MFDVSFEGVLPQACATSEQTAAQGYAKMLGDTVALSAYLRRAPFGPAHFDILLAAPKKPAWADPKDYAWVKNQAHLAAALDLGSQAFRAHCLQARMTPTNLNIPTEDFGSLVMD